MKILFDNGTPKPIARALNDHHVSYARQIGWHELTNGELIQRAEDAGYELLLSTDKNIQYQQNLTSRRIAGRPWKLAVARRKAAPRQDRRSRRGEFGRQLCGSGDSLRVI